MKYNDIELLKGKVFRRVYRDKHNGSDAIFFEEVNGNVYVMYHAQDCCEDVYIDDINGNLEDLVGSKLELAQEAFSNDDPKRDDEDDYEDYSCTWTFYKFGTEKGYVDIKWYGTSNGYYSESVYIEQINN